MTLADKIKKMCEWDGDVEDRTALNGYKLGYDSTDFVAGAKHEKYRLRPILDLVPEMVEYLEAKKWYLDRSDSGAGQSSCGDLLLKLKLIAESEGK